MQLKKVEQIQAMGRVKPGCHGFGDNRKRPITMSGKEMIVINDAQVLNELLCDVAQLLSGGANSK
jgi:hypothetical protein